MERRVPVRAGRARASRAGTDQGHGPDRDAAGRVRDGRDPVRAAGALGGAQLRPLGLHLQLHQDAPGRSGGGAARPRPGHDGAAVPARVHAAPGQDLPPTRRPRDGRHGRPDPDQGRPAEERRGARPRARRQAARGAATATTGPGSAHPGLVALAREVFDAHMPGPNQIHRQRAGRAGRTPRCSCARPRARAPRRACATTCGWACSTWRPGSPGPAACRSTTSWRTRPRPRSAGRSSGSGSATAPRWTTAASSPPRWWRARWPTRCARLRSRLGAERFAASRFQDAARLFESLCTERELTEFLTLPAYEALVARP